MSAPADRYPCQPKPFDTMMGTVMMCAKCGHGPAPKECQGAPADPVQADALVEVNQADRDAVSSYLLRQTNGIWTRVPRETLNGAYDNEPLVQAFARHRLASQPSTDAEVERKVLQDAADYITDCIFAGGAVRSKVLRYLIFTLAPKISHPPADKARIAELEAALEALSDQAAHVALGWRCDKPDLTDAMNELVVRANRARTILEGANHGQ